MSPPRNFIGLEHENNITPAPPNGPRDEHGYTPTTPESSQSRKIYEKVVPEQNPLNRRAHGNDTPAMPDPSIDQMTPAHPDSSESLEDTTFTPAILKSTNSQSRHMGPSNMSAILESAESSSTALGLDSSDKFCFFYGSLMDSANIASVLDLAREPVLRAGRIQGYRTLMNGPFPALVRAENSTVCGMVLHMEDRSDVQDQITELCNLEGEDYERHRLSIRFEDGSLLWGWTFLWVGDEEGLEEGVWDFEAWRQRWNR
ncbi:MAG: hypothetical protein Q9169_004962 [Polycauliona sp. 2 TL-2023]